MLTHRVEHAIRTREYLVSSWDFARPLHSGREVLTDYLRKQTLLVRLPLLVWQGMQVLSWEELMQVQRHLVVLHAL